MSEDPTRAAEALTRAISDLGVEIEPTSVEGYLDLVRAAATMEASARDLLHDAVASARAAGTPWSAVGSTLEMSKQAAQKRFATRSPVTSAAHEEDERLLGPVTSFDEMKELKLAGQLGWHSVEFGALHHKVVRSETQWEHRRTTLLPGKMSALRDEGWELIGTAFPFAYLKRNLGTPALPDPASQTDPAPSE